MRSAVVAEFEFQAAAAVGTSSRCSRAPSEILEASEKVWPGKSIQFSSKGRTEVVRGGLQEVLGRVISVGGHDDVYASVVGKWLDLNSTMTSGDITSDFCVLAHSDTWRVS